MARCFYKRGMFMQSARLAWEEANSIDKYTHKYTHKHHGLAQVDGALLIQRRYVHAKREAGMGGGEPVGSSMVTECETAAFTAHASG